MRYVLLALGALLLAGCGEFGALPPPSTAADDAGSGSSQTVMFVAEGAVASWRFSDSQTQVTGNHSRTVRETITVQCIPYHGYSVLEWEGADSYVGGAATVTPSTSAKTVTAILAPSGGG